MTRPPEIAKTQEVFEHLREQLAKRSIPTMAIGSGGGHDCAVFAGQGVASAMLSIRNDGGSHNPAQTMEMEEFELATHGGGAQPRVL